MDQRYPILEFDPDRKAVTDPSVGAGEGSVPERGVVCFFGDLLDKLADQGELVEVWALHSGLKPMPIYTMETPGERIAVFHPGIGAPFAAALLEEAIALGCRKLIACGGAGVISPEVEFGEIVVPTAAVRDEGTSYHYLPPAREVEPSPEAVAAIESALRSAGVDYLKGKTWTTDGIYRETPARIERRRGEGCLTVEMEAAALFAVAAFRDAILAQLLCGCDDVSGEKWDLRDWTKQVEFFEKTFRLAVEACLAI